MKVLKLELMKYRDKTYGNNYCAGQLIDIESDKVLYYQTFRYGDTDHWELEFIARYIKDNSLNVRFKSELKNLGVYVDKQESTMGYREIQRYSKTLGSEGEAL